jgi:raffinose/stachyose/melibiose transport system substrate-binding protein
VAVGIVDLLEAVQVDEQHRDVPVDGQKQGSLPALPDAGATVDPSLADLSSFINGGRTVPFMDQLWPNAKVQQDMLGGIRDILRGQSTPAEMFSTMEADYRAGS